MERTKEREKEEGRRKERGKGRRRERSKRHTFLDDNLRRF